jgi:hypothetical protein
MIPAQKMKCASWAQMLSFAAYLRTRVILNFFFAPRRTPGVRRVCAGCAPGVHQAWLRWLSVFQLDVLKLAGEVAE